MPLSMIFWMFRNGSLRTQAGSLSGPHMSEALKPPASPMARPIWNFMSDGFRKPESAPA
ncbi:Uncharacterised protein [Mycobacteroides abscessus subsp. abscessus]|nr:Uncharacterised protein [Mycobacteroides abscessus subsp. abscessus]